MSRKENYKLLLMIHGITTLFATFSEEFDIFFFPFTSLARLFIHVELSNLYNSRKHYRRKLFNKRLLWYCTYSKTEVSSVHERNWKNSCHFPLGLCRIHEAFFSWDKIFNFIQRCQERRKKGRSTKFNIFILKLQTSPQKAKQNELYWTDPLRHRNFGLPDC